MARNASRRNRTESVSKEDKSSENKTQLQQAFNWLVDENIFAAVSVHGNTTWGCASLVHLALLWILSALPQLVEAFVEARCQTEKLFGTTALTTYQGMMKALVSATPKLMPVLQQRMHELMEKIGGKHMRTGRWVAIAIDGSKETAPRTVSNEKEFCPKNYGQGKNAKNRDRKVGKTKKKQTGKKAKATKKVLSPPPQVWLAMMWHIGFALPWCWKLGPSSSCERQLVKDMVKSSHFLKNTLFIGDAGFVGYEFWKTILEQEFDFLIRVGANVRLLKDLCCTSREGKDIVHCWPLESMRAHEPPLRLRLIQCKIGKNENVWLLTSVLDRKLLTNKDMKKLYEARWGIELEFRALKQTFNRRKLRCRSKERVLTEIEWSIFGMAAIELLALKEQLKLKSTRPEKLSFAQALTATRHSLANLTQRPAFMEPFETMLGKALIDDYERKALKQSRHKIKLKKPPGCGEPKIELPTREQRNYFEEIDMKIAA